MTRFPQSGGPSRLLSVPVPFRSAPSSSSATNENNQHIEDAMRKGKDISESLADILRQSSLADNEESKLREVLSLAEELRNYQSPAEFTIAFVGETGVGKSSLINSLIGKKAVARAAGAGEFGTSIVTEYRRKRDGDNATYTIEIERLGDREMDDLLRQCVVDYRQYHLRDPNLDPAHESGEIEKLGLKARQGWGTLTGAFGNRHDCTEELFRSADFSTEEVIRWVFEWRDQIIWPAEFDACCAVCTAESDSGYEAELTRLLKAWMWPFIKVARVYLEAAVLHNGIVLVDLPGFRDINSARVRIGERRLYQCDEIFVVTEIGRASTNEGVEDVIIRQLGRNFNNLKRRQGVTIICTKSEISELQEPEILRDIPNTDLFNIRAVNELTDAIASAKENSEPCKALKARRANLFVKARNDRVKALLMRRYGRQEERGSQSEQQTRRIEVYCVSSNAYHDATKLQNRRLSSPLGATDKDAAVEQMMANSGILQLRKFIQGIPSQSQIEETRHFLETRLADLLQKFGLWLHGSVADLAANQPAAKEFIRELQTELKAVLDTSVSNNYDELNNAKTQILQQPLNQGITRWEAAALVAVSKWEKWASATILAFWRQEGAHSTVASKGWVDWNEEIIKMMVDDMQPREEQINAETERAFRDLITSTHQGLSSLPMKLEGFDGVDHFIQTFDRRKRNLEYEINTVTTWFFDKLQTIFHDLLRAHGTSYVMQHMRPMYDEIDSGTGVTKRRVAALKLRIQGDRINPRLFKEIRNLCIGDVSKLLDNTKRKLQEVVDGCSADIENDLELVRSNEAPSSDENDLTNQMFEILEVAKQNRENALRDFEAGIRSRR